MGQRYKLQDLNKDNLYNALRWVGEKLIEQGGPSIAGTQCQYRHEETRCAIGWLISDEDYKPEIEGYPGMDIPTCLGFSLPDAIIDELDIAQSIHDNAVSGPCWPDALKEECNSFIGELAADAILDGIRKATSK